MDDRIDYIKDSLDTLHTKVDRLYVDADTRLKSLELEREHKKGFMKGVVGFATIVAGTVGGVISLVANYFIQNPHK